MNQRTWWPLLVGTTKPFCRPIPIRSRIRGDRLAHLTRDRLLRWVGVALALVLIGPTIITFEARATDYRLSDLATPITVAPGIEISTVVNRSLFLFFAGPEPGQSIQFRGARNGVDAWGAMIGLAGARRMDPGAWNLTFQSAGRMALGIDLRDICQQSGTAVPGSGTLTCAEISVTERMAFSLISIDSTFPTEYHVRGSVDSAFYDTYLRRLASGPDYVADPGGILVVSPRGGATTVLISAHPVDNRVVSVPVFVYALFVTAAIAAVTGTAVGVILLRRRRAR